MATIHITPRERIVWALLVQGRIKKEIANDLGRSEHTVSMQLRRLYQKLGIHKETDLVREFFVYMGYVTRAELAEAARMPKALIVAVLLAITGIQMFSTHTEARTVRTMARAASRNVSRQKNYNYA